MNAKGATWTRRTRKGQDGAAVEIEVDGSVEDKLAAEVGGYLDSVRLESRKRQQRLMLSDL